ncbi:hypothetical protein BOTBODRAFT_28532 [Botryobasidium botryosum FD-172 SS1]|uniref:Zn(2)-C6 fungal-type domain-containing protein n=1 Tax=Botryobasidium botryosum (strain FD-172 SS1) TaxID=930990 RepID=A0A067MTV9_BOTB1|nr:hypothetical protein BOTBODRAFT_28532 [Botryobasidium botryosum FD-172 SS1]
MEGSESSHLALVRGSACVVCKRKKRGCDAAKPSCTPCVRSGWRTRCEYPPNPKEMREKALQSRIEELESRLRGLGQEQASGSSVPAVSSVLVSFPRTNFNTQAYFPPLQLPKFTPGPLDIPSSLKDTILGMIEQKDVLANIRDPLIEIFMKQRWQYCLEWSAPRFWAAYKLPPDHPDSIHPALLDAMCLLGCFHSRSSLEKYQDFFYTRVQRSLVECLKNADRLYDFIRASSLAGIYCHFRRKYIAGQNHISATIHFAMACGLHKIENYDMTSSSISPLIRQSRDVADLGDMIHTWWGLYCLDRIAAIVVEGIVTVPKDETVITTVWPCAFGDYINGNAIATPYGSIRSLREYIPGQAEVARGYNNVFAFRAKSVAMLYYAIDLVSRHEDECVEHLRAAHIAIEATSRLSDAMSAYRATKCPTFSSTRDGEDDGHDGTLIFAISMAYSASIQLFNLFANKDEETYRQRLAVARACVSIGAEACRVNPNLLHAAIYLPWCAAYEVLAWEMIRLNALGEKETAAAVLAEIEALMDLMKLFSQHFDTFKHQWPVQNLRRFNIHTADLAKWNKN